MSGAEPGLRGMRYTAMPIAAADWHPDPTNRAVFSEADEKYTTAPMRSTVLPAGCSGVLGAVLSAAGMACAAVRSIGVLRG